MEEKRDIRDAVDAADATGLVAGEELITQAETMLPILRLERPVPHKDLHAALPDEHEAHDTIDQLHAEVSKPAPDPQAIQQHVHRLRLLPELEAIVVNWWDDPRTQRFFADLGQIGV
jgi:hypothetical protein